LNILMLIWWLCLGLAVTSIIAMAGLAWHRARRNRRDIRIAARREELKQLAWTWIEAPDQVAEGQVAIRSEDRDLLLQLFSELLQKVKGQYADRFVRVMRIMGIVDECLLRLTHRRWISRAEACNILGVFPEPAARMALYRMLDDPVMEVRVEAARSLVRIGSVRSVTELVHYLVGTEGMPSLAVADLFRNLGAGSVPEMMEMLERNPTPAVKVLAIDALGHSRDLRSVSVLTAFYIDPVQTVRLATMQALGMLRDPRASLAVQLGMLDGDWEVRATAALAAGQIGLVDAVPLLEHLLEDREWWVRYQAAEALHRTGRRGVQALQLASTRAHPLAAEVAWGLLREKGMAA
jgi:HEAT repeat protein